MMGAVLNAPLAALIALLELTNTPDIILPAMIAIVVANLTNSEIFKQKAPHILSLSHGGQAAHLSMFEITLGRVGISSLMNTQICHAATSITKQQLTELLTHKPRWVVVDKNGVAHTSKCPANQQSLRRQ